MRPDPSSVKFQKQRTTRDHRNTPLVIDSQDILGKPPGRPKKGTLKGHKPLKEDASKSENQNRCSICKKFGHNASTRKSKCEEESSE
jgi:hypothetical protein